MRRPILKSKCCELERNLLSREFLQDLEVTIYCTIQQDDWNSATAREGPGNSSKGRSDTSGKALN